MALKDWDKNPYRTGWLNTKTRADINEITVDRTNRGYDVNFRRISNSRILSWKSFKTKSQAIRYARQYMRTH